MAIQRSISVAALSLMLAGSLSAQPGADESQGAIAALAVLDEAIGQLDSDIGSDPGLASLYAVMLGEEYGTPRDEIMWAEDRGMTWGQIAVLSYVQATTGLEFEELTRDGAHTNIWEYAERMEMSHEKMARSLEGFARKVVEERNSRIFDRLRATRRVDTLPDLGAGFGLFQEALDLRQLGSPEPVKVHSGSGFPSKGGTEN